MCVCFLPSSCHPLKCSLPAFPQKLSERRLGRREGRRNQPQLIPGGRLGGREGGKGRQSLSLLP